MKSLAEYLMEVVTTPTIEFQIGTTDDFIDWGAWIPNDDLTADNCWDIANAFYKKYPANYNDCGVINGINVKCECKRGEEQVKFTFYWGDASTKERLSVLEEITNLLTNTIYSVKGGKSEMKKLLNNMSF